MYYYIRTNELYHHGVKGMKWGVRRYQNKDGSYTPAGKKHRYAGETTNVHKVRAKRQELKLARNQGLKRYVRAHMDYNRELNKRNENYYDEDAKIDRILLGYDSVNRYLNKHGNVSLTEARVVGYSTSAVKTIVLGTAASKMALKFVAPAFKDNAVRGGIKKAGKAIAKNVGVSAATSAVNKRIAGLR